MLTALQQANADLERAVVHAPYDGFIGERSVQLGARVAPGTVLFQLIDTSTIEVPVALPASQYAHVKVGASAALRLDEDGEIVWRGKVARISPIINDRNRTFFAYLVISNETKNLIAAGAFVVAEVQAAEHPDVYVAPRTALVGDDLYVAVKSADSEGEGIFDVQRRTPVIRKRLTAIALIEAGIAPNEQIIVTNVEKVADGSKVTVVEK